MSNMHQKGQGVVKYKVIASLWFIIANQGGYKSANKYHEKVSKKMTPSDISKAQAMARECMDSGYTKCGY
jgi:hypothetical protein